MRSDLQKLQPVPKFRRTLNLILKEHESPEAFFAAGTYWLRDAILANWFAEKSAARRVGLINAKRPDFEVEYRNRHRLIFEATQADLPDRKIALEHSEMWNSKEKVFEDTESEWLKRRHAIPGALETASKKKAAVFYTSKTNQLIYLNLATYDRWRDEIERELVEHTKPARYCFNSVWVLWSGRIYRTWPQPFLRNSGTFRPKPHELGLSLKFHLEKKSLDEIFTRAQSKL